MLEMIIGALLVFGVCNASLPRLCTFYGGEFCNILTYNQLQSSAIGLHMPSQNSAIHCGSKDCENRPEKCTKSRLPYIVTDLLPSVPELEKKNKNFALMLDTAILQFVNSSQKKQYNDAYDAWENLCGSFFNLQFFYFQTMILTPNLITKAHLVNHLWKLHQSFHKKIDENNAIGTFVANGLNAPLLTSSQRYLTEKILECASKPDKKSLEILRQYERHNFVYHVIPEGKQVSICNRLSVLTANILCFPDPFCYFFGGASPWRDRIDRIAEKIFSTNANIVCLQEVWDRTIAKALIKRLQGKYSYFVYDAGSQYDSLEPKEIGFNSGLFIASNVPLNSIEFVPFPRRRPSKSGVNRGALKAKFHAGKTEWTLVTTHLQHGSHEIDVEIRKDQFEHCSKLLGPNKGFILGDFNINAFSEEFKNSPLSTQFFIPYLHGKSSITNSTATATDYFNDLTHTPLANRPNIKPSFELIDYCIIRKDLTSMKVLSQERVPLFSIKEPSSALSDHHGILTVWQVH